MIRLAGTVADPLFEPRSTCTPLAGAGFVSVTVPVEGDPPVTLVGFRVNDAMVPWPGAVGLIVRFAVTELAEVAVITAVCCAPAISVATLNVPLLCPAG